MENFAPKLLCTAINYAHDFYAFLKKHKTFACIALSGISAVTPFKINRLIVRKIWRAKPWEKITICYRSSLGLQICLMAFQFEQGKNAYTLIELIFNL
jgi:hypothetical protein